MESKSIKDKFNNPVSVETIPPFNSEVFDQNVVFNLITSFNNPGDFNAPNF
jgi:hypothetical protein